MPLNFVPQPGQSLGATRNLILNNFISLDAQFAVDHVAYNTAGAGKHNKVTFPVQAAAPVFAAGEEGLYNLLSGLTAINELFIHKQNQAAAIDLPLTASILSTNVPLALDPGWTYLPSGIILKWASNLNANGQQMINFPVAGNIPAFTQCLTVLLTVSGAPNVDSNRAIKLTDVNPTNFSVYGSQRTAAGAGNTFFGYLAIGY